MRVLLDEGVPHQLAKALSGAGLATAAFPNSWKQISDGKLLDEAERLGYDVLVTGDQNMRFQQNLRGREIALLVLPTNRLPDLMRLVGQVAMDIRQIRSGEVWLLGRRSGHPR